MKMKKVKLKKVNTKKTTSKEEIKRKINQNVKAIKKMSKQMLVFLIVTTIFVFILCSCLFGTLISVALTLLFILLMFFTQVLDNYYKASKKRKVVKSAFIILLGLGIIGIFAFVIFFVYIATTASPKYDEKKLIRGETTLIYDKNDELMTTLGTEKREKVTYDELPEVLVDAIIATEDSRFFQHNGLDAPRFAKAVIGQLLGRDAGGGSTLTMQVSKNNFTSSEATGLQGIIRKFTDIYLSIFKLEKKFTKKEIIEYYVNTPFLGSNSYGVEQAAQTYFGKHASEMTLSEAAIIAGLFQAPGYYDPHVNPEQATARRQTVLSLMVRHGYITQEEADIASAIEVEDLLKNSSTSATSKYQDYIDAVIQEIEKKTEMDPYVVPMKIYTNMDPKKQEAVNKVFSGETYKWINKTVQGGAVAIDSSNGRVIAIGAGRNRTGERTFSYATDISRQIGSTAKPLFDYGPAMEYNNYSPATVIPDKPYKYTGTSMTINNYDGAYRGDISLRYSLSDSRNAPALKTFQSVDNEKIKKFVTTLGITPELDSTGYVHEAHSIGAFDGTSPMQLAGAYQAFSNGGYYFEPHTTRKIILRENDKETDFEKDIKKVKAMSDSTAYMITDILRQVASSNGISGTATDQIALKTGTTNYDKATQAALGYPSGATNDGVMAGYSPTISLEMWTGYVDNKKGQYLMQWQMISQRNGLYRALAKAVFDNNGAKFQKPSSVVSVKIEKNSNPPALPSPSTPANQIVTELFKRGTEPTEVSNKYNKLENVTGLQIDYTNGTVKLSWNSVNQPNDIKNKNYGPFGYRVYLNNKQLGFTTNNYYTYTGSNPYGTYMVRTSFKDMTSNMSSGTTVSLVEKKSISFEVAIDETITLAVGDSFAPSDKPIIVYENMIDVTDSASSIHSITNKITGESVESIDTSAPGSYEITYTTTYNDKSKTFTQTVNIE